MSTPGDSKSKADEAASSSEAPDLAQAYRELAKGEQAASAMEANLTNLEKKLDAMLSAFEAATKNVDGDDVTEKEDGGEKSGKKS
ncbi:hypothetical protein ACRE_011610 [Hapsidospora chrysogenum ATCC 11550]|uniref:Uncharacterized protein n=1 Tax=Hapsidospora chrysogenum (strain ATCC 11550 / CBS 779.69 / DSM 880 / IAM 14645 / JCM 23072 / IMI 49137) TaxID=857340 RepID=A0A086TF18_HAPC1|nr:hypothetical protein ACRE_011610 [Hapsidospora chrysogenum ATCC 11550]